MSSPPSLSASHPTADAQADQSANEAGWNAACPLRLDRQEATNEMLGTVFIAYRPAGGSADGFPDRLFQIWRDWIAAVNQDQPDAADTVDHAGDAGRVTDDGWLVLPAVADGWGDRFVHWLEARPWISVQVQPV